MADEIIPPKIVDKPITKSWGELRQAAKAKDREKLIKKLKLETKVESKSESSAEPKPSDQTDPKVEGQPQEREVAKVEEPKIDVEAITRKAADEAARKVADEAKQDKLEFQTKLDAILNKDADLQQKQKDSDELIASWDKEGRLPKDYKEYIAEGLRINEARWSQLDREREAKSKVVVPETPKVDETQQKLTNFQKEITADLQELYQAKFLPTPANLDEINNPETADAAAKETQKVLAFGVKLNTERVKQGLPPVTSLNKIYFLHYKPMAEAQGKKSEQPAGAHAPVSPSRNQSTTEINKPQPFYQKGEDGHYRAKSWAQIKYESLKARVGK